MWLRSIGLHGFYPRRTAANTLAFLEQVLEEMPFPVGVTARFAQNRTLMGQSTCTTILKEDYERKISRSCLVQPIPSANVRLRMPLKYRDFRFSVRF